MTGKPPRPARLVACPGCGKPTPFAPDNPWRPFCSERCRSLDLGAWASESYRIPLRESDPEAPSAESGDEPPRGPNTPEG
ncbi:MAG: DNA gyrase inhibitor YacG [Burkholderiales bacterium]|nr:DNA gyrase inhibitor YacG [Burkholderiales bacterium]